MLLLSSNKDLKIKVDHWTCNINSFAFHVIIKVSGFHQGILKLAMEPSLLGTAMMGGGSDRKVKLDRSPSIDEVIYIWYVV